MATLLTNSRLHANCGCGWTVETSVVAGNAEEVLLAAQKHMDDTGHTVDVLGTLRPETREKVDVLRAKEVGRGIQRD